MIHRDDLPADVVAEIEKELQKQCPGKKMVFAGDLPADSEMAKEAEALIDQLACDLAEKFLAGRCSDCGKTMPNPPPDPDNEAAWDQWSPSPGWALLRGVGDVPMDCWQCPDCEKK